MPKRKSTVYDLTTRRSVHVGVGIGTIPNNGHVFSLGESEPYFSDTKGVPIFEHPLYNLTCANTGCELELVPGKLYRATLDVYAKGKGLRYPQVRGTIKYRGRVVPVTFRINKTRHV